MNTGGKSLRLIGFDSAWKDKPGAPGAMCAIHLEDGRVLQYVAPTCASFDEALAKIRSFCDPRALNIVGFDQPTIVPNPTGCRPVERAVGSLISWLGGGVQPANRQRAGMFDDGAPVWRFLRELQAVEDPERARTAPDGLFIIEVFPALALSSLNSAFFGRQLAPHYNPARRATFTLGSWRAVATTARDAALRFGLEVVAEWCSALIDRERPRKSDQDRLDSIICILVALIWRVEPRSRSAMIGDLTNGYMITPASLEARTRLSSVAADRGVPFL